MGRRALIVNAELDAAVTETAMNTGLGAAAAADGITTVTRDVDDHRSRHGLMDLSDVALTDDLQVFTCGPLPFMRHVRAGLLARGVPACEIRYEVLGPDLWATQT